MTQLPPVAEQPRRLDTARELFADADYARYWGASAAFGLGIWAFLTAMGWSAVQLVDSAFRVSLVTVVYYVPFFLFAVPAGALADTVDARRTSIVSRGLSVVVAVPLAVLAGSGRLTYAMLLVAVFLVGLSVTAELAARQALVAQLVPGHQLVQASALSSVHGGIMRVAGPIAAGSLIDRFGDGGGYALFAATGVAFVWCFAGMRVPENAQRRAAQPANARQEVIRGLVYLRNHRDALGIVAISVLAGMVGWLFLALMPLMARDVLGGDVVLLGVLNMAVGIGSVPGSVALSVARPDFRGEGAWFVGANLVWGIGVVGFGVSTSVVVSVAFLVLAGVGFGLQNVLVRTILLRIVEPAYHGRVLSTLMLTYGAHLVGIFVGGSLANLLGVSTVVAVSGALIMVAALCVVAWNRNLLRL